MSKYVYLPFILFHTPLPSLSPSHFSYSMQYDSVCIHCWISTVSTVHIIIISSSYRKNSTVLHSMLVVTSFSPFCRMQWLKIAFVKKCIVVRTTQWWITKRAEKRQSAKFQIQSVCVYILHQYTHTPAFCRLQLPNRWTKPGKVK